LVGGGTSLEEMKGLAQELGVADYVTFTGRVPERRDAGELNTRDVCVNSDVANELNDKSTMNKINGVHGSRQADRAVRSDRRASSAKSAALYARKNDALDLARRSSSSWTTLRAGGDGRIRAQARENDSNGATKRPSCSLAYDAVWRGVEISRAPQSVDT